VTSLSEAVAVILGIIAVYCSTRQNIWTYPLGIISVFIYIFIFYEVKLYADMGLQVFFIILQAYGWYEWLYGGEHKSALHVAHTPKRTAVGNGLFVILGTAILGYALHRLTDAALPYVDSFLAVLSMSGQYLLARKYFQNWHVWIAVNVGSIGMYGFKELYFTMVLYGVYLVLAVVGLTEWKKDLSHRSRTA
jgi:nicotinamide mononucleotide transporter